MPQRESEVLRSSEAQLEKISRYQGTDFEEYVAQYYLNKVRGSFTRGIEFKLTITEVRTLLNKKTCAYSGLKMSHVGAGVKQEKIRYSDLTLERVDNKLGYVKGNVVAVCSGFNQLKATFENPLNPANLGHLIKFTDTLKKLNPPNKW